MMISLKKVVAAVAILAAGAAQAGTIRLTVDNNYSVWTSAQASAATTAAGLNLVIRDATYAPPTEEDWRTAESASFSEMNGWLYVVTDSDDVTTQGFLAEVDLWNKQVKTVAGSWEVARGAFASPSLSLAATATAAQTATAIAGATWESVYYVGVANGGAPWGMIPTIGAASNWIWAGATANTSTAPGNANVGEPLIWRLKLTAAPVPEPAGLALVGLALAGVAATSRRRKA